ncbi:phosphoribosylglycinamide formyltransferase [Butyrivibrio sp. INlla18]|uniref:phosphoribosylglycinamide formyltransferase n=1 Tax=Butyrivibrio sp. INlla18 TaxID=1520806 RepID=UPI000B885505
MMKIAVMVSGGGTNLQAIIDGIANGQITNTEICLVYSNNPNAYAIERAKKAGIPYAVKSPKEFAKREDFNEALLKILIDAEPDLIVLAGCLVVIPEAVVKAFPNRIINIHPSLIPSFCGTGFYGLKVHEKVLERGARVSGATVHFVDEGTDTGPIILQKAVYVRQDDTPEVLQRRIMEEAEWKIMPKAIDLIANGKVEVVDHKVVIKDYESLGLF